jgi:hypothetical protein
VQVVAQFGQQRGQPWAAIDEVADHVALGALCRDACECPLSG